MRLTDSPSTAHNLRQSGLWLHPVWYRSSGRGSWRKILLWEVRAWAEHNRDCCLGDSGGRHSSGLWAWWWAEGLFEGAEAWRKRDRLRVKGRWRRRHRELCEGRAGKGS